MDRSELAHVVKKQPFIPVRIHVDDGSHYDIRHPDQAIVSRRSLHIGVAREQNGAYMDVHIVSMSHISRLESLDN